MKSSLNPFLHALGFAFMIGTLFIPNSSALEKKSPNKSNPNCFVELSELMDSLAQKNENSARFTEEKFLSFLKQPLKSEGTLRFRAPDYFEKVITQPKKERLVVERERVSIFDQQEQLRTFSLNDYPPLKELLNGIRFTLVGNLDGLKKYFELNLKGDCHQWNLTLLSKSASAMDIIDRIIILGEKDNIKKITWVESNGDFTVMTIEKESS